MLRQELRSAARWLAGNPGFTVTVVVTLALGIGANTAIFSVVDAILLRPLPFEDPGGLVAIWSNNPSQGIPLSASSDADIRDWRERGRAFEEIAAFSSWDSVLSGGDGPERLPSASVSPAFFRLLRARPVIGRTFSDDEAEEGVAVLSRELWARRFGSDPGAVGRAITLNGRSVTIVGVSDVQIDALLGRVDIWQPLTFDGPRPARDNRFLVALGRLRKGTSVDQARSDLRWVALRLQEEYPATNSGWGVDVVPLHEAIVGNVRPALLLFSGAVGFVLLIACANVASLLISRGAARQREVAVRIALGATRLRLVRQMLVENLLLAAVGGACGLIVAAWGSTLLATIAPASLSPIARVSLDGRVLGFALGLTLVSGLIVGLGPALHASRLDVYSSLKEGSRGPTEGAGRLRLRSLLVVSELALALVLLVGAGLLARSFLRLLKVDLGFDPRGTVTAQIFLPRARYESPERIAAFYDQLLERLRSLPGALSVGMAGNLPLNGGGSYTWYSLVPEGTAPTPENESHASTRPISPEYLKTMGIPILEGRPFDRRDTRSAPPVVIVSRTLAERLWRGGNPLGKKIRFWRDEGFEREIVGVAADVRPGKLEAQPDAEAYVPYAQNPWRMMVLVARAASDPLPLVPAIRDSVQALDKDLPIYEVRTLEIVVSGSLAQRRFALILLAAFAGVAIVLTAEGLYGVVSYSVAQRTYEIGIRLALGATRGELARMVAGQGLRLALTGAAVGLCGAFLITRFLGSLLYGVTATDPVVFAGVPALLVAVALLASYLPARRTMRVDPIIALRSE